MQIVKTKGHLIYCANKGAPSHACLGSCQKVWWPDDVPSDVAVLANPACPQCGGVLTSDIPKEHYSVISDDAGAMKKGGATITNAGLNLGK